MQSKHHAVFEELKEKLPWHLTPEHLARRKALWKGVDNNGNGYVSLAELDWAMLNVIRIPSLFDTKPVLMRAF